MLCMHYEIECKGQGNCKKREEMFKRDTIFIVKDREISWMLIALPPNLILPRAQEKEALCFTSIPPSASVNSLTQESVLRDTTRHLLNDSDTDFRPHQTLPRNRTPKSAHGLFETSKAASGRLCRI